MLRDKDSSVVADILVDIKKNKWSWTGYVQDNRDLGDMMKLGNFQALMQDKGN